MVLEGGEECHVIVYKQNILSIISLVRAFKINVSILFIKRLLLKIAVCVKPEYGASL